MLQFKWLHVNVIYWHFCVLFCLFLFLIILRSSMFPATVDYYERTWSHRRRNPLARWRARGYCWARRPPPQYLGSRCTSLFQSHPGKIRTKRYIEGYYSVNKYTDKYLIVLNIMYVLLFHTYRNTIPNENLRRVQAEENIKLSDII